MRDSDSGLVVRPLAWDQAIGAGSSVEPGSERRQAMMRALRAARGLEKRIEGWERQAEEAEYEERRRKTHPLAVGLTIATVAAYSSWGITAQAQGFTPDELVAAAARVHAIEYAVATANGTWCGEERVAGRVYVAPSPRRWLSGFMFDRPSSTPTEPVIYDVWPGSEAEKSGLRPGDRVTHVAGRHLGYGKMAQETYARLSRAPTTCSPW